MSRLNISSGAKWEDLVGYSRAVRIGNTIEVSGTVAIKEGQAVGIGDPYAQTVRILEIIKESIENAGGSLEDVIRTRIYVLDANDWEKVGRAHSEFFGKIKPATSMIEISGLISDDYLVEIEASAVISS